LWDCGIEVLTLAINRHLPDAAFIEDAAIVLDELAVLCSMAVSARQAEPAGLEPLLKSMREVRRIDPPATIEGGDVLRLDRTLLVGLSARTNAAGIGALAAIVAPLGYQTAAVQVSGCLHLKTACTALPDGRLLVNPAWLDVAALAGRALIEIPGDEPWGANVLAAGDRVIMPAAHAKTAEKLGGLGVRVQTVELSEFAKAEGGATCLSILMQSSG
jgi:dimethylargininase